MLKYFSTISGFLSIQLMSTMIHNRTEWSLNLEERLLVLNYSPILFVFVSIS